MKDIENIEDIKIMVDEFYLKVRKDDLLAPVFALRITDWQPHMSTMYRFWNAALFQVREYTGNPFAKHVALPLEGPHFEQWINLFYETLDDHFAGPVADDAKRRAMIMANTFYQRMYERKTTTQNEIN
jgi:hemoglobin